MKQRKIAVILAGLLLLAGCGNSIKNEYGTYMAAPEAASGGAAEAADTAAYDYDAEKNAEVTDEKLVYTADVTLQTRQYDDTVEKLHQAVKDAKGLIAQESQSVETHGSYKDGDGPKHLYITMRIPAEEFQAFLLKLDDLGNVISRNTYMENITRQYNDNSIEIEALQKQAEAAGLKPGGMLIPLYRCRSMKSESIPKSTMTSWDGLAKASSAAGRASCAPGKMH